MPKTPKDQRAVGSRALAHRLADRLSVILANLDYALAVEETGEAMREALTDARASAKAMEDLVLELRAAAREGAQARPFARQRWPADTVGSSAERCGGDRNRAASS